MLSIFTSTMELKIISGVPRRCCACDRIIQLTRFQSFASLVSIFLLLRNNLPRNPQNCDIKNFCNVFRSILLIFGQNFVKFLIFWSIFGFLNKLGFRVQKFKIRVQGLRSKNPKIRVQDLKTQFFIRFLLIFQKSIKNLSKQNSKTVKIVFSEFSILL